MSTEQLPAEGSSRHNPCSALPTIAGDQSHSRVEPETCRADIDVILWSLGLHAVRRYLHQRFWEDETRESDYAARVEPFPRLETVSEHSWHVADSALLLAVHWPELDVGRILKLAVLHDKLEIITGDKSPIGRDGTGRRTHAFNALARDAKARLERAAAAQYLAMLPTAARHQQGELIAEALAGETDESRFTKAVDKLQALAYVCAKKSGRMNDQHLLFTMAYSSKTEQYWPGLAGHLDHLRDRLFLQIASVRNCEMEDIARIARTEQLQLFGSTS